MLASSRPLRKIMRGVKPPRWSIQRRTSNGYIKYGVCVTYRWGYLAAPKLASDHPPVRVLGNFGNHTGVIPSQDPRTCAPDRQHGRDSKMTNFKLLGMAAILSTMIATPGIAQEAVQEPGLQAFYQSLGARSPSSATASAMASARSGSYASVPARRTSAKHYANARKM